jgi:DNA-binding SARP family transcriptional activator
LGVAEKLTVRLLGPIEVTMGGRPVVVTSGRLRTLLAVLAVLAMAAGKTVTVDRLADAVWEDELPGNTRRSVQTYVTRLRGALGAESIMTTPAGYALRARPEDIDALRFVRLLEAAAGAPDHAAAERSLLVEALALWRGAPFGGVQSDWLDHAEAPRLVERYLAGVTEANATTRPVHRQPQRSRGSSRSDCVTARRR